jgi:hypothetical protein
MSTDTDNVIPMVRKSAEAGIAVPVLGGNIVRPPDATPDIGDGDDSYHRKNDVICMIDRARGVVEAVSLVLMNQGDAGVVLQAHCACALDLANDELQRARELCERI